MQRYRRKPDTRQEKDLFVARYDPGQPLDDLRKVALMADPQAELAEASLPSGTVLVVRWTDYSTDHPAETEFEVVRAGHYLSYSGTYGSLGEDSDADLRHFYEPVGP